MNSIKVQNPRRYDGAQLQIYQEYTTHTKNVHR